MPPKKKAPTKRSALAANAQKRPPVKSEAAPENRAENRADNAPLQAVLGEDYREIASFIDTAQMEMKVPFHVTANVLTRLDRIFTIAGGIHQEPKKEKDGNSN